MVNARRLAACTLILASVILASPHAQPAPKSGKIALVGGMLLDGYEAPPIHHAAVLIDGDRIVRVGPAAEIMIPPDYQVIDTSGRTMMPGMIKVISALTRVGANILGQQRDIGTVEPGKLADIIVVNGNPLYDITALGHVETVVKGGRVMKTKGQ